ncbi:hypothetical protein HNQ94_002768 [Salirhabdus euzebyi]|uniref:DUF4190 domain-containing protein n=1 Tax=Salirhabdus euzebyi TaxID=394506 RepID=A0A841Q7H8_9BACI|nr:hypothetical protein [Salirhabdus euzebyi]MBB6454293.1 hypothetical protein [Salirhabdus euzebyi]
MASQDRNNLNKQGESPFPKENRETDYTVNTNYFLQSNPGEIDHVDAPDDFDIRDQKQEEEFAAETAIGAYDVRDPIHARERETNMEEGVEAGWGWAAIVLSLLAFFMWPLVMGIAGIVVGVMAKRRGADTLGNIAIVGGIAAIVINLMLAPFV